MVMRLFRDGGCLMLVLIALAQSAPAAEALPMLPPFYAVSLPRLAETRSRVKEKYLKPALDRLRSNAGEAMKVGSISVMDKTRVPPSGDKHDYLSLAPYSWPDPRKKDGLPYISRDGQLNPESRIGSDRPALERLASTVQTLALGYYLLGDERYAEHASKLLRVWFLDPTTRMNPHLNYAQGVPGIADGRPYGIIDTVRLVGIIEAAGLLETSRAWTPEDHRNMVAWSEKYLDWLRNSKLGQEEAHAPNNHGTWYDAQVVCLALYVGQKDFARQTLEASKHRRIEREVEPDGSQPRELARTRSFFYSLYNLRALFTLASLGERADVDLWHYRSRDGRSIRVALDAVAEYADPEKKWPHKELHFNRIDLLPLLQQAAVVYDEPRYRRLLELLPAEAVASDYATLLYPLP
jgi:hypothetical protein